MSEHKKDCTCNPCTLMRMMLSVNERLDKVDNIMQPLQAQQAFIESFGGNSLAAIDCTSHLTNESLNKVIASCIELSTFCQAVQTLRKTTEEPEKVAA